MKLTRQEVTEIIAEMQAALDVMRERGDDVGHSYTMLWRRMMWLEEWLYRHPY